MSSSLGVCSWSLRPSSASDLVEQIRSCGIRRVQLALDPLRRGEWSETETLANLREADIEVISGMSEMAGEDYSSLESIRRTGGVRPDARWAENLSAARSNAVLAARIGLNLVTLHAGFIPHDAEGPEWDRIIERLREVVDVYAGSGVRVGLETGQETAETLLNALDAIDRPTVGVNFDPANMILYGMGDPVEALRTLAPRVQQIHIKDATQSDTPGSWGAEVVVGQGQVRWSAFFELVKANLPDIDLVIEREAGDSRVSDVASAAEMVREHADWIRTP